MPLTNFNTLMFEQPAFDRNQSAVAVASESPQAITCDNAMTGDQDRHGIAAAGISHRPRTAPQPCRKITISHFFSWFNRTQALPDPALERRPAQLHVHVRYLPGIFEVGLQRAHNMAGLAAVSLDQAVPSA
jgi:hypothetical protein